MIATLGNNRTGFFLYQRQIFFEVEARCGTRARILLTELVANAAYAATSVLLTDGSQLTLRRGQTLFSSRTFAEKLGTSSSTVHRDLKALERAGYVATETGHNLKRGKASAPTIVTITDYSLFSPGEAVPKTQDETPAGKIEGTSLEGFQLGKASVGSSGLATSTAPPLLQKNSPVTTKHSIYHLATEAKSSREILRLYQKHVRGHSSDDTAIKVMERHVASGIAPRRLAVALANFHDATSYSHIPAAEFFGELWRQWEGSEF